MTNIKSIIKYILLATIVVLAVAIIIEFLPGLIERGKEVTGYMHEYGTTQGVVYNIEYGDKYTTIKFQDMTGEILTYKIENKYAGVLSIIQNAQRDKREIKIYYDYQNNIYDAEYKY